MKKFLLVLLFASFGRSLLALDDHNPVGVTGAFEGVTTTAGAYNVLNHSATRQIDDIVVPGAIGKYGLKMTRYYNSRSAFGNGWSYGLAWGTSTNDDKIYYPNGTVVDSSCSGDWGVGPVGLSDGWETHPSYGNGTFRLADGGRIVFQNHRSTSIIDPYGQTKTLTYDPTSGLLTRITEPGGRYLQFTYNGSSLLSQVDAYGGAGNQIESVVYHYTGIRPAGGGTTGTPVNCLTSVDYSDGTHAYYAYQDDNVPDHPNHPCPCSTKAYPLLRTCQDVRYSGPMRHICYEYQANGPHGAIIAERYSLNGSTNGPRVSAIDPPAPSPIVTDPNFATSYTETRGDGNITRTFNYTSLHIHRFDGDVCPTWFANLDPAPQQFLTDYTDFRGNTTHLGYDANWYVNSVRDANLHTTTYARASPPPAGIGEILTITHPGGSHIDYTYYDHGHYVHTVSNERQKVTTYTRDPDTHLVNRIDYPQDGVTPASHEEFTYNNFGQVLTHRLQNGAWESFVYGGRGLLIDKYNPKATVPNGGDPHVHYSYYTSGPWTDRVQTMTLPANVSGNVAFETYEYDRTLDSNGVTNLSGAAVGGRGLVTKITHADGSYQRVKYDAYGNKRWQDNELRKTTSYTYDEYNRLTSTTDPLQNADSVSYLNPGASSPYLHTTNSIYTYTSRAGIVTTNDYDQNWRKTSTVVAPGTLNLTTGFAYDVVGNLTDVTDPRLKVTHHAYDNRNRKTSTTEAYGITGLAATTVSHYDAANNIDRVDRPDGQSETTGYDALNRMIWHSVPKQVPGQPSINLRTNYEYDPSGTIHKITDPKGNYTTFAYDDSDRKITMTYRNGQTQQWAYDNAGNLKNRTTVAGAPEIQRFDYDERNRKTDMHWDNAVDSAHFTYYADSRLNMASNPNSTVTRHYDDAGHPDWEQQRVTGLGSTKTINYPTYDDDGRLTSMNVGSASYDYTYSYDLAGRFEKIKPTGGSVLFQYAYDPSSNETHRYAYLPNNVTIDQVYTRDSLNRMSSRLVKKNGATFSTEAYTYNHMNRLTEVDRGGVADAFSYYWDGELSTAQYGGGAHMPYTEGQEPDLDTTDTIDANAGYQAPETEEAEPAPPPDDTTPSDSTPDTTPSPDNIPPSDTPPAEDPAKGEKTVADYLGDGNMAPDGPEPDLFTGRSVTYKWDKAGNRTSVTDNLDGNVTYEPNNLNQYALVGGTPLPNGPEHEIRTYNTVTYYYINDEHLKQVTSNAGTYNLYYDAMGRCVKRTLNGFATYYIYDGEKPILEYRSSDLSNPAKNVYGKGIDEILMRYDPTLLRNQTFYYQQDHEGSVTHLVSGNPHPAPSPNPQTGDVLERYKYDAFGLPTIYDADGNPISSSAYSNRFLFTGREYANLFGFYEYRARAYHPGLGRFMSEDPKLFDAGDYNLFRYCHNDSIDFTDPMGTEVTLPPGPNHASPLMELSETMKWFDRSNLDPGNWKGTPYQLSPAKPQELVSIARRQLGVKEVAGTANNPRVIDYLKTTTIDAKAYNDSTAWCSAFVNWVVIQGGLNGTNSAAASSWRRWGENASGPAFGAIAVIHHSDGSGHVGFVVGVTTSGRVILLGGNQRDSVRYSVFGTSNIVSYRVPPGSYSGFPVIRSFGPAPVYQDSGAAALEIGNTR